MRATRLSLLASVLLASFFLSGCNDNDDTTSQSATTAAVKTALGVGDTHCPTGGAEIKIGFDTNGDGAIDKLTQTEYVCNGESGATGYNSLLMTKSATKCAAGGLQVLTGLDLDKDHILDDNEVLNTQDVCFPTNALTPTLFKLGDYDTNLLGGSEIVAYDDANKKMLVTNGNKNAIDVLDISDPFAPKLAQSIDLTPYGASVQSVAYHNGIIAAAVGSDAKTIKKGSVVLFSTAGAHLKTVEVGYLPDMVTFNNDGTKIVVANEGEPDGTTGAYVDAAGSIGIITLSDYSYVDLGFADAVFSNAKDGTPVRLGGTPSNSKTLDIEPEYITIDGNYAYVTLQENNALAKVNLTANTFEFVKSFGAKSYEAGSGNTIDIEEEGKISMKNYQGLFALYMPDSIAAYLANGISYLVTANEGGGREYLDTAEKTIFTDEIKISKLLAKLDAPIASIFTTDNDLKVAKDMGDSDGDGDYDKLYTYGARSFSIWDTNGDLIWDSGDAISKKIAELRPELFNQDDGTLDGRSGNKGGEPEALAIGTSNGKTYAFVGLERQNAIVVYNITNPYAPTFVDYFITQDGGDISPEGMKFIPADKSPNGKNLLLVSYEVSGSTAIYEFTK